jgi:hypothetical protein
MPCNIKSQWYGYNVLTDSLDKFGTWGIEETHPGYQGILGKLREVLSWIGRKLPRISINVKITFGHSPGIFTLRLDSDYGWFVEARERVGAPPIYRAVSDDIARAILKDELTLEQERWLLMPDEYVGE